MLSIEITTLEFLKQHEHVHGAGLVILGCFLAFLGNKFIDFFIRTTGALAITAVASWHIIQ